MSCGKCAELERKVTELEIEVKQWQDTYELVRDAAEKRNTELTERVAALESWIRLAVGAAHDKTLMLMYLRSAEESRQDSYTLERINAPLSAIAYKDSVQDNDSSMGSAHSERGGAGTLDKHPAQILRNGPTQLDFDVGLADLERLQSIVTEQKEYVGKAAEKLCLFRDALQRIQDSQEPWEEQRLIASAALNEVIRIEESSNGDSKDG